MVGLRVASRRFTRFGMALVDFDNDGRLDLYEANGRVGLQGETFAADPYAEPNLLFRGLAGPRFEEVQPRGGTAAALIATSRAAAFGDIDNDGGVDILVANRDGSPYLLRNVAPSRGHWAQFSVRTRHGQRRAWRACHDPRGRTRRGGATCARATAIWPPTTRACTSGWARVDADRRGRRALGRRRAASDSARSRPTGS